MIRDGVGEMEETKWTFLETPFFGRWRPRLVGRVHGMEGQAASGPAKPTLRASSGHATGGDALTQVLSLTKSALDRVENGRFHPREEGPTLNQAPQS